MSTKNKLVANAETLNVIQAEQTGTPKERYNFFASQLAEKVEVETPTYFEKIATEKGEMEISKKVYQFANPVGNRNSLTVYNLEVIKIMEMIDLALKGKTLLTYTICKAFAKIEESGELEKMNFKSVTEFGKAIYGLETSTVNHYVRIGKNFITDDFTVKSGLPELTVGHFIELSSLVQDGDITPVIQLYANGTLTDGMSTKKVRETLKAINGKAIEQKDSKTETDSKTVTPTNNHGGAVENNNDVETLQANFDSQIVIGRIINACIYIDDLFGLLYQNQLEAVGYGEATDAIRALAKALL